MAGSVTRMLWNFFSNDGDVSYYLLYRTMQKNRELYGADHKDPNLPREEDPRLR